MSTTRKMSHYELLPSRCINLSNYLVVVQIKCIVVVVVVAQRSTPLLKTKPQTYQKTNYNPKPNLKKNPIKFSSDGARICSSFCILHVCYVRFYIAQITTSDALIY